jgi:hypothetical protein
VVIRSEIAPMGGGGTGLCMPFGLVTKFLPILRIVKVAASRGRVLCRRPPFAFPSGAV